MISVDPANPKGIVWLASYPRSGNTWTRVFFATLTNIINGQGEQEIDLNRLDHFSFQDSTARPYERYLGRAVTEATPAEITAARPEVNFDRY